tara:strand:+ start:296 stop:502 length:207 start_codon:yes stop_codon:yes gene_type:complete
MVEKEEVNHPDHYNSGQIECIEYIKSIGMHKHFCIANAIKYLSRCQHKGSYEKDLKKAKWYIEYLLED